MNQFSRTLSNAMTPLYVEKFQLSHAPFSERYSEALYYEDDTRTETLKKIAHLTDYTNLILFIQGAEGLGKTSLLKHRLNTGKTTWRICYFNAKDYVTSEAFIEKLFTDFQLKYTQDKYDAAPKSLHEQIESLRQTGLTPIIIIDDVEQLNPKLIPTLQSLIYFNDEQHPIVRLIVAGEDIPDHLQKIIPIDNEKPAIKYLPIPPMSEKETSSYIRYRLAQSGYKHVEPFNKNKLKKIYLDSKGFPKYINILSDHVMGQYAQTSGDKQNLLPISDDATKKLKIAAAALASVTIITLIIIAFDNDSSTESTDIADTNIKQLELPTESQLMENTSLASVEKTNKDTAEKNIVSEKTPSQEIQSKQTTPKPDLTTTPAVQEKKPKSNTVAKKQEKEISTPRKTVSKPTPEPKPKPKVNENKTWIAQQNPRHYTLQLIATGSEKAAESFIKKHKIEKHAHYFHSLRKGKDWYSVIYKSYPNARSARQDIDNLPPSLRKIKPWIRRFKDIN